MLGWGWLSQLKLSLERVASPGFPGSNHPLSVDKSRRKLIELKHEGFLARCQVGLPDDQSSL